MGLLSVCPSLTTLRTWMEAYLPKVDGKIVVKWDCNLGLAKVGDATVAWVGDENLQVEAEGTGIPLSLYPFTDKGLAQAVAEHPWLAAELRLIVGPTGEPTLEAVAQARAQWATDHPPKQTGTT